MATLKTELLGKSGVCSVTKDGFNATTVWRIVGTNTEEILANVGSLGYAPGAPHPVFGILSIIKDISIKQEDDRYSILTVTYEPPEKSDHDFDENNEAWEMDMVAKQVHINAVEETSKVDQYNGDGILPEATRDTAIGRNGDRIQGASVYRPFGAARCVKRYEDKAIIDKAFRTELYTLQGKTNDSPYLDWEIGEVLFLGTNIRYPGDATAEITFQFLFGVNPENPLNFDVFYTGHGGNITESIEVDNAQVFDVIGLSMSQRSDVLDKDILVTGIEKVGKYTVYDVGTLDTLGLVGPF